jgi:hypothetical protein
MNFLTLTLYKIFEVNKKHLLKGTWNLETRGGVVVGGTVPRTGRQRVRSPMASLVFFTDLTLSAFRHWDRLTFERK